MSAPPQVVRRIATFRLAQLLYDYTNKVNENIAAIYKEWQVKRMKDVFHLSSHRKVMHTEIPGDIVLLLALWETFSGVPVISFQPSWSWASIASFPPLTSCLHPVTLRTHSFHSLWFHPRLLWPIWFFSWKKLHQIRLYLQFPFLPSHYCFTYSSPPRAPCFMTLCPTSSSDHLLLASESNMDPFPVFKLWSLVVKKRMIWRLTAVSATIIQIVKYMWMNVTKSKNYDKYIYKLWNMYLQNNIWKWSYIKH